MLRASTERNSLSTRPVNCVPTAFYIREPRALPRAHAPFLREKRCRRRGGAPHTRRRLKHASHQERSSGNTAHLLLAPLLRRSREGHASRSTKLIDYSEPWRRVPRVHAGGRPIPTFPRRCRQFSPVDESFRRRYGRSQPSSTAGTGIRECARCYESSSAGRTGGRREDLHRLPSARSRSLHPHLACPGSARRQSLRPDYSGLRGMSWPRLRTRRPSADQGAHYWLHEGFWYAHRNADEDLSYLPRRRSSRSLGRLCSSAQRSVLQRLP